MTTDDILYGSQVLFERVQSLSKMNAHDAVTMLSITQTLLNHAVISSQLTAETPPAGDVTEGDPL